MGIRFTCRCGKRLFIPDDAGGKRLRCPGCGGAFLAPSAIPPERPSADRVVLVACGESSYSIAPTAESVASPDRAQRRYKYEVVLGLGWHGFVSVAAAAFGITSLLMYILRPPGWDLPRGPVVLFGILFMLVFLSLGSIFEGRLVLGRLGRLTLDRRSPEGTLKTFLNSILNRQWRRAYNCLSDTAQNTGYLDLPRGDFMHEMMPDVEIKSLGSFRRFWSRIKLSFQPQWSSMRKHEVDENAVKLSLSLRATWRVDPNALQEEPSASSADAAYRTGKALFQSEFLAVRRGRYWFLANGFLWPQGAATTEHEG